MLNITSAKLAGNPDASGWVQVFDEKPLYVVVTGNEYAPASQNIFAGFRKVYLATSSLKTAVQKLADEFGGQVEIAAAVYVKEVVYTVVMGGAQARISRGTISAKILDSHSGDPALLSASGHPQERDVFILESRNSGGMSLTFQKGNMLPTKAFSNLKSTLLNLIPKKVPQPEVFVQPNRFEEKTGNRNREVTMTVAGILGILLLVSIVFGIRQKNINDNKSKYQARLDQAISNYQQAVSVMGADPVKARDLFTQSRDVANELQSEKVKDAKLTQLFSDLTANQSQILGEYPTDPKVFQDLSIQTNDFNGTDIASSGDIMFILDRNSKKIIEVEIATKKTQMAAGPDQIDEALGLASYEDRVFISNSTGVYELGDTKKQSVVKDWTGEVLPYAFAGNIYLLDKSGGTIWRYVGSNTGFAAKQNWLGSGVEPDFSNVMAMTIDGNIFALTSTGKILKFSQGTPQDFTMPPEVNLTGARAIYTNGDLQYFYILNPQEKKIYVLNKNGDYKGAYQSDLLAGASGLVVSEKDKKMIFLSGSKLYSIDIAHL